MKPGKRIAPRAAALLTAALMTLSKVTLWGWAAALALLGVFVPLYRRLGKRRAPSPGWGCAAACRRKHARRAFRAPSARTRCI